MNIYMKGIQAEENPDVLDYIRRLFDLLEYLLVEEKIIHGMFTDELKLKTSIFFDNFQKMYNDIFKKINIQEKELGDFDIMFTLTDNYKEAVLNRIKNDKTQVKLVFASPIYYISRGIRYSHSTHDKSDTLMETTSNCVYPQNIGDKDYDLIKRIGIHMNHESVLEHSLLIFDIKMSTKALLEESRHRIGVSQTVTSSRYALRKVNILFERTDNVVVDKLLKNIKDLIIDVINSYDKKEVPDDALAMALPQAFIYELQLTFNLRSLRHFLHLRLPKSAHRTIRKVAVNILDELQKYEPKYFELLMEDEDIRKHYYAKYNDEFRGHNVLRLID